MNLSVNKVSSFYYIFLIAEFAIVGAVASLILFSSLAVSLCKGTYVK
jgi:hypothetical protein